MSSSPTCSPRTCIGSTLVVCRATRLIQILTRRVNSGSQLTGISQKFHREGMHGQGIDESSSRFTLRHVQVRGCDYPHEKNWFS